MAKKIEVPAELLEKLAGDPDYIKKVIRSGVLTDFKQAFEVTRSSGLRCPACSQYGQGGGSLWGPREDAPNQFVCYKCHRIWVVECVTQSIDEVIAEVKESKKR